MLQEAVVSSETTLPRTPSSSLTLNGVFGLEDMIGLSISHSMVSLVKAAISAIWGDKGDRGIVIVLIVYPRTVDLLSTTVSPSSLDLFPLSLRLATKNRTYVEMVSALVLGVGSNGDPPIRTVIGIIVHVFVREGREASSPILKRSSPPLPTLGFAASLINEAINIWVLTRVFSVAIATLKRDVSVSPLVVSFWSPRLSPVASSKGGTVFRQLKNRKHFKDLADHYALRVSNISPDISEPS